MLAELFYPKELKDAIKKLRAENDLNEGVLREINFDVYKKITAIVFVSLVFLFLAIFIEDRASYYLVLLCALSMLIFAFIPSFVLNKYSLIYNAGEKTKAEIDGANYEYIPAHGYKGWSIRYHFSTKNSQIYKGSCTGIQSQDLGGQDVKAGDSITIFYLGDRPRNNCPLLKSKYKKFSLKKES